MSGREPPATRWSLPAPRPEDGEIIAVGGNLEPGTLLAAYRSGLFPMPLADGRLGWWSPDPRCLIELDGLRVSRSLGKSTRRYVVTIDRAFERVVEGCADPARPHAWIEGEFVEAYSQLHRLGWAHSVEAWADDGELAGGLYGVAIGGLFAGESMFHRRRDASKVALVGLVDLLRSGGAVLLDVQWCTDHLTSLGAVEVPRPRYLSRLAEAVAMPVDPFA